MNGRALIFDHDGTVIDSLALVVAASNAVRADLGQAPAPARTVIDGMVLPTAPRMGELCGIDDPVRCRELAEAFYHAARRLGSAHAKPYPGMLSMLRSLRAAGWILAMVTNNEGRLARRLLVETGLAPLFSLALGEEDVAAAKPAPDGIRAVLWALGMSRRRAIYVGDAGTDAQAARAAGIRSIAVSWGTHRDVELARAGFSVRCRHAGDLLRVAECLVPDRVEVD